MASAVLTVAIIFVAEAIVVDVVAESGLATTRATAIAVTTAKATRRLRPTGSTLGAPTKEAVAVLLTPSVGPDHAGEPQQRGPARAERGADRRPLAASGHARP